VPYTTLEFTAGSLKNLNLFAIMSIEVDLAHKEQALQKLAPVEGPLSRFTAEDPLLAFLTSL
jgi:hypothetical protein